MKSRFFLALTVAAVCFACAYLATVLLGGRGGDPAAQLAQSADPSLVAGGEYVAILGDCTACHTAPSGQAYAGGLPIETPIGTIYSTNITADERYGIGRYSLGDFERAVRRGIRADGIALYPAMPFPSYARMSDTDLQALYAYFMNGVKPAVQENKRPAIAWPLSTRWPLTYWRWIFAPAPEPPRRAADDPRTRGAYLVEGLGHCGSCHTPRGIGLEERALTDRDGPLYLAGGLVDRFVASDLRGDPLTGLGSWSEADIVEFLQTGRSANAGAFGGMVDVVAHSTQFMTKSDLEAIASYLKSLPPAANEPRFSYQTASASALASGKTAEPGALDYLNGCAACHRSTGLGYQEVFPALAGNPVVNAADPSSLIHIVLTGASMPGTDKAPVRFTMPPFGGRLSDKEVADVLTFIRSSWGNSAPPVTASAVAKLRPALATASPPPAG